MGAGGRSRGAGLRGALGGLALAALSVLFVAGVAEAVLRAFPGLIPAGTYGVGRFDPALGMHVRTGEVLYTKRGVVRKRANADGFLDVPHLARKPPATTRVGFFGDSYVEANQVPTEATFFRLLPALVAPRAVESFGFGLSGWGTLQAFRAFQVMAPRYDLDVAVYVFVENDPGDNALALSAHRHDAAMPYATLVDEPPGYRVHEAAPPETGLGFRAAKAVQARSLLAQVVWVRMRLLQQEGLRPRARSDEHAMRERASGKRSARPNPNEIPSSWADPARDEAARLTSRILADWKRAADAAGRPLVVLYVPRGNDMLSGVLAESDSWLPWLRDTCARLDIRLLDPSAALRARMDAGERMFGDHLSEGGHRVFAEFLARELQPWLAHPPAAPGPR